MSRDDASNDPEVVLSERFDPDTDDSLSLHVVRMVAIASDTHPVDLSPLDRAIDTDVLDKLVNPSSGVEREGSVRVSFDYENYQVEIDADGLVRLLLETREE